MPPVATDGEAPHYVTNAGLVLLWPFLPAFFEQLDLAADGRFTDVAAQERAVAMLGFVATGSAESPEQELAVAKVLCGWPMEEPIQRFLEPSDDEETLVDGLLETVVDRWEGLGGTSIGGLRTSFLQRDGRLRRLDHGWSLLVSRVAYDLLLERLPWPIGHVVLPWMERPVYVEW
jgi:hypothetical protein